MLKKNYDVVVVGAGITGLATALFLAEKGIRRLALLHDPGQTSQTSMCAGILAGGQSDNYTRVAHAHGEGFARDLWRFGDRGFDLLTTFAKDHNVAVARQRRLRLVTSVEELTEVKKAVALMSAAGFAASLLEASELVGPRGGLSQRVLAIQDDGDRGAIIEPSALIKVLEKALHGKIKPFKVQNLEMRPEGVTLSSDSGQVLDAEVVVLCNHLAIAKHVPGLANALVSYADQWHIASGEQASALAVPGTIFSANYGYEWGACLAKAKTIVGGARFLRHMAGIGATAASVEPKCTKYLMGQTAKIFSLDAGITLDQGRGLLECWPCDELPIIGPMFGETRLLLATGFNGSGLTMGFHAGYCLAELIASGKAESLPDRLWPHRLRSLA